MNPSVYLADLDKVGINDIDQVGGKNASLGEMLQNLGQLGIKIPGGFVITVAAYREFIRYITWMKPYTTSSTASNWMTSNR